MIKQVFLICMIISVFSALTKSIILAIGNTRISCILQPIFGIIILIIIVTSLDINHPMKINLDVFQNEEYYYNLNQKNLNEIIISAEESIAKQIKDEISDKLKYSASFCKVEIDKDTLKFKRIKISFPKEMLISSYKIQEFIKTEYDSDAEIIFDE